MTTPTHDVRNWLKLNLLIDKACHVLRQLFQKSWETRFGREWSGTQDDINIILDHKQMKTIGKLQRQTILSGDVNSWDLTTLRAILTLKDCLNLTAKEASNINSIAEIRNKLAHSASKGITDDELNAHWCTVSAILVQCGESEADLELLKQERRVAGVEFLNKEEPINDESKLEAQRLKEAGNAQFKMENWADSIKTYTEAILLPGLPSADRATLYCNRSIAFLKQNKLSLALDDAKRSIELWPEWWRGHYRMGQIYTEMNKYKKAEGCFDEAFAREPHRVEIEEARSYARMKGGQLERNDAMDAHFVHQTLDDAICEFERRTVYQVNTEAVKKMLHSKAKNDFIRNWQDCLRGNNCQIGADGYPRDYGIAAKYYKKAADRGSAEGLRMLAVFTLEGKGVKRDIQLGIKLLEKAAAQPPMLDGMVNFGVAEAEHTLGLYCENGIGVAKNEFAAMDWYRKACEHGSVTAANNLGLIYMRKGDNVKAEQYLKMAANTGYAKAMVNLAGHYCCQGNADLALTWCQRARNAGETSTDIDHIEKASNDAIHGFKECKIEEWESDNAKTVTGMSIKERMERFAYESDPKLADFMKVLDEFAKETAKNKERLHDFIPDQLKKHAKSSTYARELWNAQNHYFMAISCMMELGFSECSPPLSLYEKFITELSSCAKIEFMVAQFPVELHQIACSLVEYLLTLESTFHEDTRVCYVALNGLSSKQSSITFLSECIRKYPENVYFTKTRGQLNAFLEQYEDGIRDINASIKLDPSRYDLLYDRAAMMRLFYPKVSAEATIAAYNDFLAVAPEDHRKVPESYYGMAQVRIGMTAASKKRNLNISAVIDYYNLGVEAEGKQLPFFLPYQSNTKASVELLIKPIALHESRNGKAVAVTKYNKPQVADSAEGNVQQKHTKTDEKPTTVRKDRVFRSALSDPSRENMTKSHRKLISGLSQQFSPGLTALAFSFKPRKVQKSASSLIGLKAITLNEMYHSEDKIYNGHVLAVTIIDEISFMSSMTTIIEDSSGDVLRCAIYNWPHAEDRIKARKVFGIGCKISIINPYMRMAVHGQTLIRIDDPTSIIFHGFLEKMCRYCCEPNASKSCKKCNANYCDRECQMLDWKRDHKMLCSIYRNV